MAEHFDAALGGTENVPQTINCLKFAQARVQEIKALNHTIEQAEKGGLIFQRLPKAMRRRVMAHHSKRMPRRLQEAHSKQLEKNGVPTKAKCPSRKHRRKPDNLLLEYNRRQRNFMWLETHVWHAKRFRMIEKWNYKIAYTSYNKVFRSSYRASSNHCLLQDISYYCCIEVKGPQEKLIDGLKRHVSDAVGLTFSAKAYITGCKEGNLIFFHQNKFPFNAVGPVTFLWKPEEHFTSGNFRVLWLWTHPSVYEEIINCLIDTFSAREETELEELSKYEQDCKNKKEMKKLETHKIFNSFPSYFNRSDNLSITLLKDKLNRFRLTGPLSHSVLIDALNVVTKVKEKSLPDIFQRKDIEILDSDSDVEDDTFKDKKKRKICYDSKDENTETIQFKSWWKDFYNLSDLNKDALHSQSKFWVSLKGTYSPAQLPPHQVIGLTVVDPRYQLPAKRMKSVPDVNVLPTTNVYCKVPQNVSCSPIWSSEIRMMATKSKLSSHEWAKQRSRMVLVPGISEGEVKCFKELSTDSEGGYEPSYIPVVLIQRPGSQNPSFKRLGFGSGWDIIIPAGWAMPFWIALIFRGAKPGGMKEATMSLFEAGVSDFLDQFSPDTEAGKKEEQFQEQQRKDKYFRMPPNKRPNFIKFGIASPFSCCWDKLLHDWCQNKQKEQASEPFYVLRDRVKLEALRRIVNCFKSRYGESEINRVDLISQFSSLFSNMNHNCLIPVKIESLKKGCPSDCAMICLPNSNDLSQLNENLGYKGPVEQAHCDSTSDRRKDLQNQHKKELKRLRKQRVQNNNKQKKLLENLIEKGETISHILSLKKEKMPSKEINEKYLEEMEMLWVPEASTIKESCDRLIVGFVCKGDFSLSEAHGMGLGYVPLPALVHLISTWLDKPIVLYRNNNSLQYRFAILKVC